eukprot:8574892-Pyramimonas_sp.AAC.2
MGGKLSSPVVEWLDKGLMSAHRNLVERLNKGSTAAWSPSLTGGGGDVREAVPEGGAGRLLHAGHANRLAGHHVIGLARLDVLRKHPKLRPMAFVHPRLDRQRRLHQLLRLVVPKSSQHRPYPDNDSICGHLGS